MIIRGTAPIDENTNRVMFEVYSMVLNYTGTRDQLTCSLAPYIIASYATLAKKIEVDRLALVFRDLKNVHICCNSLEAVKLNRC
jgi:hypothetical protein